MIKQQTATIVAKTKFNGQTVVKVSFAPKEDKVASKDAPIHAILLIDRSGSMYADIGRLISDVQQVIMEMRPQDYVSVIWYSGEGQTGTILTGASTSNPASICGVLDKFKSTVGCTCFSEALGETKQLIANLKSMCANFVAIMFTDGEPVVFKRTEKQEMEKSLAIVDEMKNDLIALYTVGYRQYYNKTFLTSLAEKTALGKHIHTDNIKKFLSLCKKLLEESGACVGERIEIKANGGTIWYLGESGATAYSQNQLVINLSGNDTVMIEGNAQTVTINGQDYPVTGMQEVTLSDDEINTFGYLKAFRLAVAGNMKEAKNVCKALGDKALIDEMNNAFTNAEKQQIITKLEACIFDATKRFAKGKVKNDYVPDPNAFCVFDLFRILSGDEANRFIPPVPEKYKRIGVKMKDAVECMDAEGQPMKPFVKYGRQHPTFERLTLKSGAGNLSLGYALKGVLKIGYGDKEKSLSIEGKKIQKVKLQQTNTFVKDGALNIKTFKALVTDETYKILLEKQKQAGKKFMSKVEEDYHYNDEIFTKVTFKLEKLPVINPSYVSLDDNQFAALVVKEQTLKAQQTFLNFLMKTDEVRETVAYASVFDGFTSEQVAFLQEHYGLRKDGSYSGGKRTKDQDGEVDYFYSRQVNWQTQGYGSAGKISDVIAKIAAGKNLNQPESVIKELYEQLKSSGAISEQCVVLDTDAVKTLTRQVKNELSEMKYKMSTTCMALFLNGEWFPEFKNEPAGSDKYTYHYAEANKTVVLTLKREKNAYSVEDAD